MPPSSASPTPAGPVLRRGPLPWPRLALLALPLILLVAYQVLISRQEARQEASTQAINLARGMADNLETLLRKAENDLGVVSHNLAPEALDPQAAPRHRDRVERLLADLLGGFGEIHALRIFDKDGQLLYTSSPSDRRDINVADRPHFHTLRSSPGSDLVFSPVYVSRASGRPSLFVSRSLRDSQGRFQGIALAALEVSAFQETFRKIDLGPLGSIALRRVDDGALVARLPDMLERANAPLSNSLARPRITAGDNQGSFHAPSPVDGVIRTVGFRALPRYPFYLVVGLAEDDYLAAWRWQSLLFCAISLALLGVAGGGMVCLARGEASRQQAVDNEEKALAALQDSQSRLSMLLEHSPDTILIASPEGHLLYANPRAEVLLRHRPAALLNLNLSDLLPADTPEAAMQAFRLNMSGDGPPATHRLMRRDGTLVMTEVNAVRMPDGNVLGILRDVSLRHATEQQLLKFSLAVAQSPHSILITNTEGEIEYVNAAFTRITGYTLEEVLGRTPKLLKSGLTPPATYSAMWDALHEGQNWEGELFNRRKNGESFVEFMRVAPVRQSDGTITHYLGMIEDVTERIRLTAERDRLIERLRTERDFSRALIDSLPDVFYLIAEDGHFVRWNRNLEAITGRDADKMAQTHPRELFNPRDRQLVEEGIQAVFAQGRGTIDADLLAADGSSRPYLFTSRRIHLDDQPRILGFGVDVSRLKAMEAELLRHRDRLAERVAERTAELERMTVAADAASRAKSAFLANMSHEIRTPMNAIIGMAHLMRRGPLDTRQEGQLNRIDLAARHLLGVINDILDLSKIEAGKMILEERELSVGSVLDNIVSMLTPRARAKGLEIVMEADDVPRYLIGDVTRLTQAMLNYANNAVKFTDTGRLNLRCRVDARDGERLLLRFEVQDTGVGIPVEHLERLFAPFEQADNSIARQHGGTGLGLAITRNLAALMGGEAGARSEAGVGSTFWFTAWLRQAPDHEPALRPERIPAEDPEAILLREHTGRRLLVVEDNIINQEVVLELLDNVGLCGVVANDGQEALALCASEDFDLVLMDMQMPVMDGLEATRQIRRQPQCRDIPIIAMTANAFTEDRSACLQAGMDEFLSKPVDPDALYATLLLWLTSRSDPRPLHS
ncbi:PAS domain S-box protein [Zoogloea sp.]|uniref:PAS domain S-box protein n=1 Tax=Zoogloea sp. TaxID=49181 RepID=UPI001415A9E6|nr:MAG: PAS domain S-box protein [Zoogloea sp.]